MSESYTPHNVLDRLVPPAVRDAHFERAKAREAELVHRHLGRAGGDALSVGCGWHPGRHLLPAPAWRLTAADLDPNKPMICVERGEADAGLVGRAGELDELPDGSFDVVLYRLVLHHIAYQGSLDPVFAEARRLLRPGGALVAVEPNLWHPVGLALAGANRLGVAVRVHGTPDDIPLSPRALARGARAHGLEPEIHAVTYAWQRLPLALQRALAPLHRLGSLPGLRLLGHELLLIARRAGPTGTVPRR